MSLQEWLIHLVSDFYLCKKPQLSIWRKREYSFRDASLREDGRRNPTGQGLEIKAGIGELTSENVVVQADKFIQTADAGQRFILRLGVVAVPVISIGAAYILIKRKYIIDERKYEELVAEIKSTNKKWFNNKAEQ